MDIQFLQEMSNVKGDMKSLTKSVNTSIAGNNSIKSSLVNLHRQLAKQSSTKEILNDIKKSDIDMEVYLNPRMSNYKLHFLNVNKIKYLNLLK